MAPAGEDGPHPAVVPPAGPATPPKAEADSHQAGHARGTGRAARYAVLLTSLLTVTAPSSDRGPLTALPSHHGTHARSTSRAVHPIRVTSGDLLPEAVPTVGDDLQVLHPVARGDTLIVTVTLTHAGSGAVTVPGIICRNPLLVHIVTHRVRGRFSDGEGVRCPAAHWC
ncbi:hypothetical protein ACFZCP_38910 [Streptomyces sp. NPDC007971]|uniref:hypothetical protein n=1 Tax=Streptomyces sp. NPDC007971 TaxID=3364799 RepID=UPI0036E41E67